MPKARTCSPALLAISFFLTILTLHPFSTSADTIVLKSGKTIESPTVWEENGLVKVELHGQVVGYPKEKVAEISRTAASKRQDKSDFALDLWALGMQKQEVFQIAEANDKPLIPAHHIAVAAHFNRSLVEKYADSEDQYYFKEALFGRPGRVTLDFSPQTNRLATVQYGVMIANLEEKTRFCTDAEAFFEKRYGKAEQRGGTSSMHRELFWKTGPARIVELVAGPTVRITYKTYEAPAAAASGNAAARATAVLQKTEAKGSIATAAAKALIPLMAKIVVGFGILCGLILLFKFFLFRQLVKSLKSDRSNNFFQFLLSRFFEKQQKPNFSYKSRGYLCTQAEKKFFDVLAKAVGETYFICPKVRIADVIEVESKYFRSSKSGGFNKISQKHLDFVICDAGSMAIIGVVELDDRSHLRSDRMARDEFVDRALETAGIPIFHQPTRGKYSLETLKSELAATLGLQFEETKDNGFDIDTDEPPKNRDKRVSVLLEKTVAPCPDCGGKLDKKKIVRGVHAGKIVLACRNQPKCRYLVPYRHQPEGSSIPSEPEVSVSADDVDEELERREPRLN